MRLLATCCPARSTRCARSSSSSASCCRGRVAVAMPVLAFWYGLASSAGGRATTLPVAVGSPRSALTQVLAHGMTSPLREMTAAARAMARGDYSRRVRATSRDEVGRAGAARSTRWPPTWPPPTSSRRELIANVSHELRTPITALQAVLENIVDGVRRARPGHAAHRARPDRAARPAGHASCSTCPASTPARSPLQPRRVRRWPTVVRRGERGRRGAVVPARRAATTVDVAPPTLAARRRPAPAAPGAGQPARQRRPAQPAGRHRHRPRPARATAGLQLEVVDEGPGIADGRPGAGVRAVHRGGERADRRRHRARAGHRPLGGRTCTAARSPSSGPDRAVGIRVIHSRCCLSRRRTWRCIVTTTTTPPRSRRGPIGPRPPRSGEPGGSIWAHRVWPAMPVAGCVRADAGRDPDGRCCRRRGLADHVAVDRLPADRGWPCSLPPFLAERRLPEPPGVCVSVRDLRAAGCRPRCGTPRGWRCSASWRRGSRAGWCSPVVAPGRRSCSVRWSSWLAAHASRWRGPGGVCAVPAASRPRACAQPPGRCSSVR